MPAKSVAQEKYMHMLENVKKGKYKPKYNKAAVEKAARSMALSSIKDFQHGAPRNRMRAKKAW